MTNWGTAKEIPDYTTQGGPKALFDFNRLIAVADLTTNSLDTNTYNNHFTNVSSFAHALNLAPNHTLEIGV